jgi:hypothetical protein
MEELRYLVEVGECSDRRFLILSESKSVAVNCQQFYLGFFPEEPA